MDDLKFDKTAHNYVNLEKETTFLEIELPSGIYPEGIKIKLNPHNSTYGIFNEQRILPLQDYCADSNDDGTLGLQKIVIDNDVWNISQPCWVVSRNGSVPRVVESLPEDILKELKKQQKKK